MVKLFNVESAVKTIRKYDRAGRLMVRKFDGAGTGGELNAGRDAIYAGGPKAHPDAMTGFDRGQMKRLGWLWDDAMESWVKFL